MERINLILQNKSYQENLHYIEDCERDRIYCRHDMAHFLDVARLAVIMNLKEQLAIAEENIYAAALLHDIGRHKQYTEGVPHEEASVPIADKILEECHFSEEEKRVIIGAIASHRTKAVSTEKSLSGIIYRGDKASRACYACAAESECNWQDNQKNMTLIQ